jgi:hypothetical protein
VELHVSVQHDHYVRSMKARGGTYEEDHCEEETSGHKHCKEEKPSCFEGNSGEECHPTWMSLASSEAGETRFAPAPPMMNQRSFGGRAETEERVLEGEARRSRGDPSSRKRARW